MTNDTIEANIQNMDNADTIDYGFEVQIEKDTVEQKVENPYKENIQG